MCIHKQKSLYITYDANIINRGGIGYAPNSYEAILKTTALVMEQNAWHEYIALQEIHAYVYSLKNEHDHDHWIYKTAKEWQEMFPFWTPGMIKDILFNLENMGYLTIMTGSRDSTSKCYQINYAMCV
ncbi:hypothetical protein CSV61_01990 [Sporosarcina sp. P3]|uniref:hypothetical protein n=1 Tax=Sporosarcina sp. P3 TaxID=2048245 RepID=UPI000C167F6C|nr:hypothetical protein [Sporosarcina sp. P3]PID23243.1 hypothetical protein CSV61_01990 [Sporosarcina sp. P3]